MSEIHTVDRLPLEDLRRIDRTISVAGGSELHLAFENPPAQEVLEGFVSMLADAYTYLHSIAEIPEMSDYFVINFINSGDFSHQGIHMRVPVPRVKEAINAGRESYLYARERSILVHELLHNLVNGEEIPMFAELISITEGDAKTRIEQIIDLLQSKDLGPQHVTGLEKIATYLGFSNPVELLQRILTMDRGQLKQRFAVRAREIMDEEFAEMRADFPGGDALQKMEPIYHLAIQVEGRARWKY